MQDILPEKATSEVIHVFFDLLATAVIVRASQFNHIDQNVLIQPCVFCNCSSSIVLILERRKAAAFQFADTVQA